MELSQQRSPFICHSVLRYSCGHRLIVRQAASLADLRASLFQKAGAANSPDAHVPSAVLCQNQERVISLDAWIPFAVLRQKLSGNISLNTWAPSTVSSTRCGQAWHDFTGHFFATVGGGQSAAPASSMSTTTGSRAFRQLVANRARKSALPCRTI